MLTHSTAPGCPDRIGLGSLGCTVEVTVMAAGVEEAAVGVVESQEAMMVMVGSTDSVAAVAVDRVQAAGARVAVASCTVRGTW